MPIPLLYVAAQAMDWPILAETLGLPLQSPDLDFINSLEETLTIDHVRSLNGRVVFRPVQGEIKTLVMWGVDDASLPAQNALLKILEEAPDYIQLVLTAREMGAVLPTVHSRCLVRQVTLSPAPQPSAAPELPLVTTLAEVFERSEALKERDEALRWCDDVLVAAHQEWQRHPTPLLQTLLSGLIEAREQLGKNANVRLVIEHLLLTMFSCNSTLSMSR